MAAPRSRPEREPPRAAAARVRLIRAAALALAVAACPYAAFGAPPPAAKAQAPAKAPAPAPVVAPPPSAAVTPEQTGDDYELAFRQALLAYERGDHQTALLFYERVLGRAPDPREQLRALMCMAMLRLSPSSKLADPAAAEAVIREFSRRVRDSGLGHEYVGDIELLRLLQAREKELKALRQSERKLRSQLAAKEELVRKLRALTVEGG